MNHYVVKLTLQPCNSSCCLRTPQRAPLYLLLARQECGWTTRIWCGFCSAQLCLGLANPAEATITSWKNLSRVTVWLAVNMVFLLCQLQEKCCCSSVATVSGYYQPGQGIWTSKQRQSIQDVPSHWLYTSTVEPSQVISWQNDEHSAFDGDISEEFGIKNGLKQGFVLAPTLFSIFFALLLKHALNTPEDSVYLHTRSDGHLFNISHLRSRTKI